MRSGKHAEIRPLGKGKGQEEEFQEVTDRTSTRSKIPGPVALEPTNDKGVPGLNTNMTRSRPERTSEEVGENSADANDEDGASEKSSREKPFQGNRVYLETRAGQMSARRFVDVSPTFPSTDLHGILREDSGTNQGQLLPASGDPPVNTVFPPDPYSIQFRETCTSREQQASQSAAWLLVQERVDDLSVQRQAQHIRRSFLPAGGMPTIENNLLANAALRVSPNGLSDQTTHVHSILRHDEAILDRLTSATSISIDEEARRSLLLRALVNQSGASFSFPLMLQRKLADAALLRAYVTHSQPSIRHPLIDPHILPTYLDPTSLSSSVTLNPGRGAHFSAAATASFSSIYGDFMALPFSSVSSPGATLPSMQAIGRDGGPRSSHAMTPISESFPVKLHRLLRTLEHSGGRTDIISFLPNGDAFAIHKPGHFESDMMRNHFPRMTRIASFMRQLNLYDFRRMSDASTNSTYYHPNFKRDFPSLCREMKRTKIKSSVKNET